MNLTRGNGLMSHVFDDYAPVKEGNVAERRNGVLISQDNGEAVAYALWKLQDRGRMFVSPGEKLYEGMIIGIHSRENDLVVNPIKGKQLTNVRASGTDEAVRLVPPVQLSLEAAVEFIAEDELVELTPKSIRLRKRYLTEIERKRAQRGLINGQHELLHSPARICGASQEGGPLGRFFRRFIDLSRCSGVITDPCEPVSGCALVYP
jgi:GTP-binding protein